ncbi:unnamed protein product [Boreogadus saida]
MLWHHRPKKSHTMILFTGSLVLLSFMWMSPPSGQCEIQAALSMSIRGPLVQHSCLLLSQHSPAWWHNKSRAHMEQHGDFLTPSSVKAPLLSEQSPKESK